MQELQQAFSHVVRQSYRTSENQEFAAGGRDTEKYKPKIVFDKGGSAALR